MDMRKEPFVEVSRGDFAALLSRRAQSLLERIAGEIERDEQESALWGLMADAIAAGDGAAAEAVRMAMHWAPAVVVGNVTETELIRRVDGIVSPKLLAAAVANYREVLRNVVQRWAGAIADGYATEVAIVEELGIPADVVSAAVAEYRRAHGSIALAKAAEKAERAASVFRAVVTRK